MYHYTYLITYTDGKKYMGVRSCKCLPEDDYKYLGSSKHTPSKSCVIKKDILAKFPSRKEAIEAEIAYQRKHKVSTSDEFYNRSIQTSVGFDTTGVTFSHSAEHRRKIKQSLTGRKRSPEECKTISEAKKGKKSKLKHTEEHKQKISQMFAGKPKSKEALIKMVATRKANNSYITSKETKAKISQSLLENPPFTSPVEFTQNGVSTKYNSIAECSRATGISAATMKGRLNRKRYSVIKGWAIKYIAK